MFFLCRGACAHARTQDKGSVCGSALSDSYLGVSGSQVLDSFAASACPLGLMDTDGK